jgi:CheY-like chemotaxis protein
LLATDVGQVEIEKNKVGRGAESLRDACPARRHRAQRHARSASQIPGDGLRLVHVRRARQDEGESRPFSRRARRAELAAHGLGQRLGQRESYPGALGSGQLGAEPLEGNEDALEVIVGQARPGIGDHDADLAIAVSLAGDRDQAASAVAAIEGQPALILLDNRLPDAMGDDVLRQLAADQSTARIPVIVVSGDSARETASELRALGAVDFLAKPFDIHQFLSTVGHYLG